MDNECPFCGKPVDKDNRTTWKQVEGWVGGPKRDSMRLRRDTGEFAHDECVLRAQRGISQDQTTLLDDTSPVVQLQDNDAEELGLFE